MSFKRVILPGFMLGLVVVLLAVGTAYYGFLPDKLQRSIYEESGFGPKPDEPDPSTAPPPAFTKADTTRLAKSLNSPTRAGQANALIPALRDGKWDPKKVLPEGTNLTLKPDTFRKAKDGDHTVQATATGTKTASFLLHLAAEDNQWLITRTERTDTKTQSSHPKPEQDTTSGGISPQLGASRLLSEDSDTCTATKGKTSVLLVHGFNSNKGMWSSMRRSLEGTADADIVDPFDYSNSRFSWVTDSEIGPALVERVSCLYAKSGKKVVIVAHSMGGLAARYALSEPGVADKVGLVETIATPHLGTKLANVGTAILQNNLCTPTTGSLGACVPEFAVRGLSRESRQLAELPHLPAQIPVRSIAGDVTVGLPYLFTVIYDNLNSDKVVGIDSATAEYTLTGRGDGKIVFTCRSSHYLPNGSASCEHNGLPNNPEVQASVKKGIELYLAATGSVTRNVNGLSMAMQPGWKVLYDTPYKVVVGNPKDCKVARSGDFSYAGCSRIEVVNQNELPPYGEALDGMNCTGPHKYQRATLDGASADHNENEGCSDVYGGFSNRSWWFDGLSRSVFVYDYSGRKLVGVDETMSGAKWTLAG